MSYNKVYEVYRKNPSTFPMAVAYLTDKGYEFTKQITDEDIAKLEGNGLMTKKFVQELVRTAREITEATDNNAVEIIQFCAAEEIFDTEYYTGKFKDDEEDEDCYKTWVSETGKLKRFITAVKKKIEELGDENYVVILWRDE